MSLPRLPEPCPALTRECALNMILASIAAEETAISRLIDAQSEQVRCLGCCPGDASQLACANQSVSSVLEMVAQLQLMLKGKMEKVLEAMPPNAAPEACCCDRSTYGRFISIGTSGQGAIAFEAVNGCLIVDADDSSVIPLPGGARWLIQLVTESDAKTNSSDALELALYSGESVMFSARFSPLPTLPERLEHSLMLPAPDPSTDYRLRLFTQSLKVPSVRMQISIVDE